MEALATKWIRHFHVPPKNSLPTVSSLGDLSSCKLYKTDEGLVKVHATSPAFWREVFWYISFQGSGLTLKILGLRPDRLAILLPYLADVSHGVFSGDVVKSLASRGVRHNQEVNRHVLIDGGISKIIDWQFASWLAQPSLTLGFASCEIECPWHPGKLCVAKAASQGGSRCHLITPTLPSPPPKIAVLWRGVLKSSLAKGLHATPYMAAIQKSMEVDALHPSVLGSNLAAIQKCGGDLFIHGWVGKASYQGLVTSTLESRGVKPKGMLCEDLAKSFSEIYRPLEDLPQAKTEPKTYPGRDYVYLHPRPLQRWWSTWYSLYTAFSLIPDPETYDLIVVHRPDMVIPEDLDYRALDPTKLTILMQQNPNAYNDVRPGYHDWWLAGPPSIMAKIVAIYPALLELFAKATHPEERSSHPLLRQWCEDHNIPVACLHYTQVRKVYLVDGRPTLGSVQTHCPMTCPEVEDQRKPRDVEKWQMICQGPFVGSILANCSAYIPGVLRCDLTGATGPTCLALELQVVPGLDHDVLLAYLKAWQAKGNGGPSLVKFIKGGVRSVMLV